MIIVIPSVNYSDYLSFTLPHWKRKFPKADIRILTQADDCETQVVAKEHAFVTPAWFNDGVKLNCAAAHDACLAGTTEGEIVVSADADVLPRGDLPYNIRPDTIYGCPRYDEFGHLIIPRSKKHPVQTAEETALRCLGFFKMFRYSSERNFGSYPDFELYDVKFAKKFPSREALKDFYVVHVGEMDKRNWKGRTLPPFRRWELLPD